MLSILSILKLNIPLIFALCSSLRAFCSLLPIPLHFTRRFQHHAAFKHWNSNYGPHFHGQALGGQIYSIQTTKVKIWHHSVVPVQCPLFPPHALGSLATAHCLLLHTTCSLHAPLSLLSALCSLLYDPRSLSSLSAPCSLLSYLLPLLPSFFYLLLMHYLH